MTLEQMDGYSVSRGRDRRGRMLISVYYHNQLVGSISTLREATGQVAFVWHDARLWPFNARDFVVAS